MIWRATPPQRALQQQGELLTDPHLSGEVVQPLGPQGALDCPLAVFQQRRDQALAPGIELGFLGPGQMVATIRHCLLSFRSAARRAVATSTVSPPIVPSSSSAAMAWSASLAGQ